MKKENKDNSNINNGNHNQNSKNQDNIIRLDGKKFKPACVAPIDIEMLNEHLKNIISVTKTKKFITNSIAEFVGNLLNTVGLDPAAFIIEDESIQDYMESPIFIIEEKDGQRNGNGSEDADNNAATSDDDKTDFLGLGPCFIMAGDDGYEYKVRTRYAVKTDGDLPMRAILLRSNGESDEIFDFDKKKWDPDEKTVEKSVFLENKIDDMIGDDVAAWEYLKTYLDYEGPVNEDSIKYALERDRKLIDLYRLTREYMYIDWINMEDDDIEKNAEIPRFGLIPKDPLRTGIAVIFLDGICHILAYIEDVVKTDHSDCPNGEVEIYDYTREIAKFDSETKVAEYLFKACNRFTCKPIYTIPVSQDAFVDIEEDEDDILRIRYANKDMKLFTKQENERFEDACRAIHATYPCNG